MDQEIRPFLFPLIHDKEGGHGCRVANREIGMGQRVPGYNGSMILFKPIMVSDFNVILSIFTVLDHSLLVEIPFITFADTSVKWNVSQA